MSFLVSCQQNPWGVWSHGVGVHHMAWFPWLVLCDSGHSLLCKLSRLELSSHTQYVVCTQLPFHSQVKVFVP